MSDRLHDPSSDVILQLQEVLRQVERSIDLLEPLRPRVSAQYNKLRKLRDQLEEAFVVEQTERLRKGALNFEADLEKLRSVVRDLEAATQRAARAREIIAYATLAVDLVVQIIAKIIPFL